MCCRIHQKNQSPQFQARGTTKGDLDVYVNSMTLHQKHLCILLEMGNFYIVEAGGNGFAAHKQKKNSSQGSKADKAWRQNHFHPTQLYRNHISI